MDKSYVGAGGGRGGTVKSRKVQGHLGDSGNIQMALEVLSIGFQPLQNPPRPSQPPPPLWGDLPDATTSDHSWDALPMGQ